MFQPQLRPLASGCRTLLACQPAIHQSTWRSYSTALASASSSSSAAATEAVVTSFEGPGSSVSKFVDRKQYGMRSYKPRTPGVRHLRRPINDHLWKGRPYLPLTFPKKGMAKGGRNHTGKITVRHRGGGAKRRIRTVDFYRTEAGPHQVDRIEYDPGRSAHIALLTNPATGRKSYIVAAEGMRAGDVVQSYRKGIPKELLAEMGGVIDPGVLASKICFRGNCLPLYLIPVQTMIYNVGCTKGGKAMFCRSAGTYATIVSKDEEIRDDGSKVMTGKFVNIKLQSGEVRKISKDACATIGQASNPLHHLRQLGKAGRSRLLNIRPTVRGVAMNANDHPHGGGRGKSKGNRIPTSPWGTPAKGGYKTRKKNNPNKMVVIPRERNMGARRVKKKKDDK